MNLFPPHVFIFVRRLFPIWDSLLLTLAVQTGKERPSERILLPRLLSLSATRRWRTALWINIDAQLESGVGMADTRGSCNELPRNLGRVEWREESKKFRLIYFFPLTWLYKQYDVTVSLLLPPSILQPSLWDSEGDEGGRRWTFRKERERESRIQYNKQ